MKLKINKLIFLVVMILLMTTSLSFSQSGGVNLDYDYWPDAEFFASFVKKFKAINVGDMIEYYERTDNTRVKLLIVWKLGVMFTDGSLKDDAIKAKAFNLILKATMEGIGNPQYGARNQKSQAWKIRAMACKVIGGKIKDFDDLKARNPETGKMEKLKYGTIIKVDPKTGATSKVSGGETKPGIDILADGLSKPDVLKLPQVHLCVTRLFNRLKYDPEERVRGIATLSVVKMVNMIKDAKKKKYYAVLLSNRLDRIPKRNNYAAWCLVKAIELLDSNADIAFFRLLAMRKRGYNMKVRSQITKTLQKIVGGNSSSSNNTNTN